MSETGILSREAEKKVGSTYLDNLIKAGLLEPVDGLFFTQTIRFIDDRFGAKLPEKHQIKLRSLFDSIIVDENYKESIDNAMSYLDGLINIPVLGDVVEEQIFSGFAMILKAILQEILRKKERK